MVDFLGIQVVELKNLCRDGAHRTVIEKAKLPTIYAEDYRLPSFSLTFENLLVSSKRISLK